MRQHGGHDVGVMHLPTAKRKPAAEEPKPIPHRQAVLQDAEAPAEAVGIGDRLGQRERRRPDLRPGRDTDIRVRFAG